jgi:hypothetical protein
VSTQTVRVPHSEPPFEVVVADEPDEPDGPDEPLVAEEPELVEAEVPALLPPDEELPQAAAMANTPISKPAPATRRNCRWWRGAARQLARLLHDEQSLTVVPPNHRFALNSMTLRRHPLSGGTSSAFPSSAAASLS